MKRKIKSIVGYIITFIIMAILGAFFGNFLANYVIIPLSYKATVAAKFIAVLWSIICVCLAAFLQIIFHELGHLVCGLLSGYKFASFRIGNLMLVKKDGSIRLKRFSLMGTGGQCLMAPPDMINGRIPYALFNLGGSLSNFLVSMLFFLLYWLSRDIIYLSELFIIISFIGIAFGLMNGIPMHVGVVNNDGFNALSLRKNDMAMRGFWVQMKVNALITDDTRLKDMPEEWFAMPSQEALKNDMCAVIGVLACNRAIDQMNFAQAKQIAQELIDKADGLVDIHRFLLKSELIYCELIGENTKEVLQELYTKELSKFIKAMNAYPSVIRMQYAYELLAKNNEKSAQQYLNKFNKIAKTYPHACEIEGERELIEHANKIYSASIT